MQIEFLGEIPLEIKIRKFSDEGTPIVYAEDDNPNSLYYHEIAQKIINKIKLNG